MKKTGFTNAARRWFAEDLRVVAPVLNNPAIIDAFAKIPREKYLGAGPWRIHPRSLDHPAYTSPTAENHHVYHDVLIAIDEGRGVNNGLPSMWAYYFDYLDIKPGATVLQVGAGAGYYTAIMAELVGPTAALLPMK